MPTNNLIPEKAILANIDLLTNLLIKIHQAEEQNSCFSEIKNLIQITSPLLVELAGGKSEFLEQMYQQLIIQKLKSTKLTTDFDALSSLWEQVFSRAIVDP